MLYNICYYIKTKANYVEIFVMLQYLCLHLNMIKFSPPISEHFCPLFVQTAQMGLILPRWGLTLPRKPPPQPLFFTQQSQNPVWDMYINKKTQPHPKTPLSLA